MQNPDHPAASATSWMSAVRQPPRAAMGHNEALAAQSGLGASRERPLGNRSSRRGSSFWALPLTVNSAGRSRGPADMKGASMARHALGVLGVVAAGVLLAVSAAMNYRFGFSLGKTALDGEIYGAASAAADCFKALVPFFLFAAIRNRMWSQAAAAAVVLWSCATR